MKQKLKKLGVLAVVLLAGAFSQVGNAQEVSYCGSCGENTLEGTLVRGAGSVENCYCYQQSIAVCYCFIPKTKTK